MRQSNRRNESAPPTFDFIIVGAGTAGCILASRLGASGHTILVLEAGQRHANPLLKLPVGVGYVWNAPAYNWSYVSEPEHQLSMRTLNLPRGRLVGGSSAINAMNFVRGNRADFDGWKAMGLEGWSYDEMLPHFRRLESFEEATDDFRGGDGPVPVTVAAHDDPLVPALFSALGQLGYRQVADYNALEQVGFGRAQFNIAAGRRQDAASCFLHPALLRNNVQLITGALVHRIAIRGGRAENVVFERDGELCTAIARREVILCAGAFNSPQILKLSGVGPTEELRSAGIEVVRESAGVGGNLIDHPRIAIDFERRRPSQIFRMLRADRLGMALARGWTLGTGPAVEPLAAAHLFAHSRQQQGAPDLQFLFRLFNPRLKIRMPFRVSNEPDCFGVVACLLNPKSRGTVSLRSADPHVAPAIRTNLLVEEEDRAVLTDALRTARRIGNHDLLRDHLAGEYGPSAATNDEASIADFVRQTVDTIFHPAGTCAMGTDDASPLTHALKVRGISGLRVADASAMPTPISGNINAAVMAVAERAADLVLANA